MAYRIYYNTLNKELKNKINTKSIPKDELKKIYEKFMENRNKKKKTINIVMLVVIAMFVIMVLPIIQKTKDPKLTNFLLLFIIPAIAVIYILVYFTQIGLIKMQFDNIIKKNYPELASELKL